MHWLQTLDTRLFDFINQSLANPFFDWLMPVLSGNGGVKGYFLALAITAGLALLGFGTRRARLCVVFLAFIVATNDALICNTIKHAVARPRPFVVLPEARLFGTVGKGYVPPEINGNSMEMAYHEGRYRSMPSSHAANWFAATMALFLFYRKSLWYMLPLAIGVSFSRVYLGVHYPSDVLAGAIIGAGYAIAVAVAIEWLWQSAGKEQWPRWYAKMPSLVPNLKIGASRPVE
jgi:undecaprenyl-diphosphatase